MRARVKVTAQFNPPEKPHQCLTKTECYCKKERDQWTVVKYGEGSNAKYAVRDAVDQIFADDKLKGKRREKLFPITITADNYIEMNGE